MRSCEGMTFTLEEHERRLGDLRRRMTERHLDAVVISDPENLFYLTEYQTTGYSYFQALIVPLDGVPLMITRQLEESNVWARTWVEEARHYSDTGDAIQLLSSTIRELGLAGRRIGYERNSYFFPAYQQDRFLADFPRGELIDCFGIVEEGRVTKSPAEIDVMRRAAAAGEAGMLAGLDAVAEGVNENEIASEIARAMFLAGGEAPAVMPYVTSGPRTMIGHATWEGRTVQAGEHVFLEVGGCFRRYHAAMMRTAVLGEPSRGMREAERVSLLALDVIHELAKPGLTVSDLDNNVRRTIQENDAGAQLITRAGYSIGIAFPPSWDEGYILSIKGGDPTTLRPGMTLHVIPWTWGVEGDKTCGISDTIVITDDGCESLFTLARPFIRK